MTRSKRVRVDVSLSTIEKTLIDNDVEIYGINRSEAIRRRAFGDAPKADPTLSAYRSAVQAVAHSAGGQLPPAQIEAIAASVINAIFKD